MNDSLITHLNQIGSPRLLVVGDLILDRYTWGATRRVSPEAPVVVLEADQHEVRLGGAASVGMLARTLGGKVSLAGVVGDDPDGRVLRRLLVECGINQDAVLTDADRVTTTKERFMGRVDDRHAHPVLRVDREVRRELSSPLESQLLQDIFATIGKHDAVLISDYAKGVCTANLISRIMAVAGESHIPVFVDPGRNADCSRYGGATTFIPNRVEAEAIAGKRIVSPHDALDAARHILPMVNATAVLVKLDSDGMVFVDQSDTGHIFPTQPRAVHDVTGAGDIVLAMVAICRTSGIPWQSTIQLANIAAGLEVEKLGVAPVAWDEIRRQIARHGSRQSGDKIVTLSQMEALARSYRGSGLKVVFTNGCFDLLHIGHITCLEHAAQFGDVLIVAINSDESVRRLKGDGRPICVAEVRSRMLAALEVVDYVLVFDGDKPCELLERLRPDVLVKGGDYEPAHVVGHEIVHQYGGEVRITAKVPAVSTTNILNSVVSREVASEK